MTISFVGHQSQDMVFQGNGSMDLSLLDQLKRVKKILHGYVTHLIGKVHLDVSKNSGFSPQIIHFSIGFSIINHPFWSTPIFWKKMFIETCLIFFFPKCVLVDVQDIGTAYSRVVKANLPLSSTGPQGVVAEAFPETLAPAASDF